MVGIVAAIVVGMVDVEAKAKLFLLLMFLSSLFSWTLLWISTYLGYAVVLLLLDSKGEEGGKTTKGDSIFSIRPDFPYIPNRTYTT